MLKPMVFWGASGHAKVLREFMHHCGYELVAVFDNNRDTPPPFPDVPLYSGPEGFDQWKQEDGWPHAAALVAIGGARGRDRHQIQKRLESDGLGAPVVVHPRAFVAASVMAGSGTQILVNATLGVEVRLGEGCIVNTSASVDHECVLGHGVHVAPGATLAGCVSVGDYSLIGPSAVVLPRVRVGQNVIIGAGSVVTRDIPDNVVAFGAPARVQRNNLISA
ncbi:MAG: acetyltransferase [Gemmatimonadota bacterium]|nr:acetyltransferase [Gemmatimonadota bacterium]